MTGVVVMMEKISAMEGPEEGLRRSPGAGVGAVPGNVNCFVPDA